MIISCNTIVDRRVHVQYLTVSKSYSANCTCSLTDRVRATDRHCRKMRRNNKFGAKKNNLATTIGERKIASKFFCLASESSPHCLVPLNGHHCVS